jgi:hypothetical protein
MSSLALTGIAKNSSMVALPSFLSSTGDCAYGSFFDLAIQLCKTIMEIAMSDHVWDFFCWDHRHV